MKKLVYLLGIAYLVSVLPGCKKSTMIPQANQGSTQKAAPALSPEEDNAGTVAMKGRLTVKIINAPYVMSGENNALPDNQLGKETPGVHQRYEAVFVDVQGVMIHNKAGWHNVPVKAAIYNLVNLNAVLASNIPERAGMIDQIRLVLGNDNSVKIGADTYPLLPRKTDDLPTTVDLFDGTTIESHKTTEIVLSFDPNLSVTQEAGNDYSGDKNYYLKPVIKVKSIRKTI